MTNIGDMTDRELLVALNEQVIALAARLDENLAMMNARFDRGRDNFGKIEERFQEHEGRIGKLEVFRQWGSWVAMAVGILIIALLWAIFTGQAEMVFK